MATLSEANYFLVLDFPTSQESTVTEQTPPQKPYSLLLYQKYHSTRNEEENENAEEIKQEDEAKVSQEPIEEFEVNMISSEFQIAMFVRSLFLYVFWMSGVGLLLAPLLWCCGPKFFRNHFKYADRETFIIFGFWGIAFFAFSYEHHKSLDMDFQSAYYYKMMLICSFASAAFHANLPKKFVDLLKNIDLSSNSFEVSRFRVDTFLKLFRRYRIDLLGLLLEDELQEKKIPEEQLQQKEATEEEEIKREQKLLESLDPETVVYYEMPIQNTISRLNIDISLFYLSFFEKTPQNLLRKVLRKDTLRLEGKQNKIIKFSKMPKSEILRAITSFEDSLFYYKYWTKSNKYDQEKAHAYMLARDIFRRLDNPSHGVGYISLYLFIVVISSVLFSFGDIEYIAGIRIFWTYLIIIFSISSPYICLSFFLYKAVSLMKSKSTHMEELEKMISTKSNLEDEEERAYPNLNILDFMTLKSWVCLRKIFMHLNHEKEQGAILAISIMLILQLLTLIVVGLYYLKILGSPETGTSKTLIIFTLDALVFLATFFVIIYYAAKVNSQFEIDRNIIRAHKQTAATLFQLYPDFVGPDAIEPGTYIYNVGLNYLKKEFGEDLSHETKEKMEKKYKTLMETYDSILEELDYEERHYPVKILGLPITKTVVKSFGAVLISISTPFIKQGFAFIYSLAKKKMNLVD